MRALFAICLLVSVLFGGCALPAAKPAPLRSGTPEAPLEISGALQQDLYLGGTIRVSGDLLVPAGHSLRFAAGSTVLVVGTDSTKVDPEYLDKGTEILVHGMLHVDGSETAPVTFKLDPATPYGESWGGIELDGAREAVLRHADLLGSETGILAIDSPLQLEQVNILGARYGVLLQGHSRFAASGGRLNGGDAGLLCYDQGRLDLNGLQLSDNLEEGLYLAAGCTLNAQHLQIARNDLGLVATAGQGRELKAFLSHNRIDFKPLPEAKK